MLIWNTVWVPHDVSVRLLMPGEEHSSSETHGCEGDVCSCLACSVWWALMLLCQGPGVWVLEYFP